MEESIAKNDLLIIDKAIDPESTYWVSVLGEIEHEDQDHGTVTALLFKLSPGVEIMDFAYQYSQIEGIKGTKIKLDLGFCERVSTGCFIHNGGIIPPNGTKKKIKVSNLGYPESKPFDRFSRMNLWKDNNSSYGFPFREYGWLPVLVQVDHLLKEVYIIPSFEVGRFYYCTSDNMARAIFRDDSLNRLYHTTVETNTFKNAKFDGTDLIELRKGMYIDDAEIIARIALYKQANDAVRFIWNSIQLNRKNSKYEPRGFAYCFFPFNHKSILDVSCIDLGLIEYSQEYYGYHQYHILRINSCSMPFLSEGFEYRRETDATGNDNVSSNNQRIDQSSDVDSINFANNRYSQRGSKKNILREVRSRFPNGPVKEKIKRSRYKDRKTKRTGLAFQDEEHDLSTLNQITESESNIGRGGISSFQLHPLETGDIRDQAEYIKYLDSFSEVLEKNGYSSQRNVMELDPDSYSGKANIFAYGIKIGGRSWRGNREVVVLEVSQVANEASFYLIDVLPRTNSSDQYMSLLLVWNDAFTRLQDWKINEIIDFIVIKQSVLIEPYAIRNIRTKALKRSFGLMGQERLFQRIIGSLELL